MDKVVITGNKIDFHIHSFASRHKESDDCVDNSTIDNLDLLVSKLNARKINMCSISDHDNFDYAIYKKLKEEENKGSIKKVFPAVEFSVVYDGKVLHIITIFDDKYDTKISKIQSYIFNNISGKPYYDNKTLEAFSEEKFLEIIRNIDTNVVMIAHQKETLSSEQTREHDVKNLGDEKFDEIVFMDYFESFEFKNKRNEIFNKFYIEKNKEKYKDATLRFVTGSDCHRWNDYPEENEKFNFTFLKCLPSFRGIAMAFTNTKRINFVNNFFPITDKNLNEISITINSKNYNIPLSKGLNVIIGDNSIGKSLLIHKLTGYKYLNDTTLKDNYEKYLLDNNIKINSNIPENYISRFDGQGSIRKMFENKSFDSNEFLNGFFPSPPLVNKYIDIYKTEIDNYLNILKNKEELLISKNKQSNFQIIIQFEKSNTLNLKKVTQSNINLFKKKIINIGKIVENFETINRIIDKLSSNVFLEDTDKKIIENNKSSYTILIAKYRKKIKMLNIELNKINEINDIFDEFNKKYEKTKTDETGKISNYENQKQTFINNIVTYFFKNKNQTNYIPNISKEEVPVSIAKIGKYRFVVKTCIKEISSEHFITVINSVLGKSIKNINDVNSQTIPEKFSNRLKDLTYDDKLANLKAELYASVEEIFKTKKAINDINDKDVMKELSDGFNSKIYFDLISNQLDDNKIYIIDQPEDDVSQSAIKKNILTDFYDMGKNKQILIITHNPQFIVNLDVDNVIFIGKDDNNEIFVQSGALEYVEEKYDILDIVANNIEGGIDSINERWKKYEKNIYYDR
jgi:hypothetical protein